MELIKNLILCFLLFNGVVNSLNIESKLEVTSGSSKLLLNLSLDKVNTFNKISTIENSNDPQVPTPSSRSPLRRIISPGIEDELTGPTFILINALNSDHTNSRKQYFDNGIVIEQEQFNSVIFNFKYIKEKINENIGKTLDKQIKADDLIIKAIKKYKRDFLLVAKHEFLMVCAYDMISKEEYYFVVDRRAESPKSNNTLIRFIYTDMLLHSEKTILPQNICKLKSNYWAEGVRSGATDKAQQGMVSETTDLKREYKMSDLIKATEQYVTDFPKYSATHSNCQQYATGFYNAMFNGEPTEITNPNLSFGIDKTCSYEVYFDKHKKKRLNLLK